MAGKKNKRFAQADREALLTLALYAFYFLWWYGFAYGLGGGDPKEYSYILGFPAWFFFSCIAGCPVLTLALWVVLRKGFRDMPLDARLPALPPGEDSANKTEACGESHA
jgi:uncharacterized membrane protein YhdT